MSKCQMARICRVEKGTTPPFGEAEFHSEPGRFPGPCRKFGLIDQKGPRTLRK